MDEAARSPEDKAFIQDCLTEEYRLRQRIESERKRQVDAGRSLIFSAEEKELCQRLKAIREALRQERIPLALIPEEQSQGLPDGDYDIHGALDLPQRVRLLELEARILGSNTSRPDRVQQRTKVTIQRGDRKKPLRLALEAKRREDRNFIANAKQIRAFKKKHPEFEKYADNTIFQTFGRILKAESRQKSKSSQISVTPSSIR